jgi:hypothetical protein
MKVLRKASQATKTYSSKQSAWPSIFEMTNCLGKKASMPAVSKPLIAIGAAPSLSASQDAQKCYASARVSSRSVLQVRHASPRLWFVMAPGFRRRRSASPLAKVNWRSSPSSAPPADTRSNLPLGAPSNQPRRARAFPKSW